MACRRRLLGDGSSQVCGRAQGSRVNPRPLDAPVQRVACHFPTHAPPSTAKKTVSITDIVIRVAKLGCEMAAHGFVVSVVNRDRKSGGRGCGSGMLRASNELAPSQPQPDPIGKQVERVYLCIVQMVNARLNMASETARTTAYDVEAVLDAYQVTDELPAGTPPTNAEASYAQYSVEGASGIEGNDYVVWIHPNGLGVVALSKSHAALGLGEGWRGGWGHACWRCTPADPAGCTPVHAKDFHMVCEIQAPMRSWRGS